GLDQHGRRIWESKRAEQYALGVTSTLNAQMSWKKCLTNENDRRTKIGKTWRAIETTAQARAPCPSRRIAVIKPPTRWPKRARPDASPFETLTIGSRCTEHWEIEPEGRRGCTARGQSTASYWNTKRNSKPGTMNVKDGVRDDRLRIFIVDVAEFVMVVRVWVGGPIIALT